MKKMMVYAYTRYNLGDDLFIKVLCERYKNTKFTIYAPKKYKYLFKNIKNIRCISSESIINRSINFMFRKLGKDNFIEQYLAKKCDGGIYIGGSLFIQGENWREYMNTYIKPKKIKNKPFYLLGVNFGPYNNDEFYHEHKEIFKEYTDICFREQYSYDLFKDLDNVRMADDIIFQYKHESIEDNNKVAISVIKPSYRKHLEEYDEVYYEKMKDIAIEYIENDIEVTFISFCKEEGDEEAINHIIKRIPEKYKSRVNSHYYNGDIDETIDILAKSKYVIASRFHAMILGWTFNKYVLPIIYSEKMTNVINQIKFKGKFIKIKDINEFNINELINSFNTEKVDVKPYCISSNKHFEKLDEFIGESEWKK